MRDYAGALRITALAERTPGRDYGVRANLLAGPFVVVIVENMSEAEIAVMRTDARKDITRATEYIQMMAAGLREYATFGAESDRETKVATLYQAILETWPQGAVLIATVAINMLSESDMTFEVAEQDWFKNGSDQAKTLLRDLGLGK